MRISIIVYVSITFVINLVKTQELAVTYMTMHMGKRKFYSYREKTYATIRQMLMKVIKDHKHIDLRNLLMTKISSISNGVIYKKEEQKYRSLFTGNYVTHISPFVIIEYFIKNKLKYICNGNTFYSYYDAFNYAMMAKRNHSKFPTQRPSSPLLPPLKNINWAREKVYCKNFWLILWKFCDYYCYSRNNFEVMKQKFLLEVNYYREKYGAGKLVESKKLSAAALNYLKEVISLSGRMDITKFENVGKGSLARAPLIMNHWFGEHKNYNWKTRFGSTETRHFTAMVWKSASKIGIGVVRSGNDIYVKVMYNMNVNMPNQFEENVLKKVSG
uniref:SCP domain-containing protein n=1 Tax=Strongyloides papillosus TaxID=174720 RepID=A0A0N5BLQ7_STREA